MAKTKISSDAKGEISIERWSPTQWHFEVTNCTDVVVASVVLNEDAMEELADFLNRMRRGDASCTTFFLNNKGEIL